MLVGAGMAEAVRATQAEPVPRWRAWGLAAVLAASPDADIVLGLLLGKGGAYHGTFTHSITAVVLAALFGYALGGGRWAAVAAAGYASHLFVDLLDDSGPTNLMLGWPFSGARPYSIGKLFPKIPFETGEGPVAAFLSLFRPDALWAFALQTLLGAAFFAGFLLLARGIRSARPPRPTGAGR